MKKSILTVVAAVFLIATALYVPREAEAVPAFARQTGMSCNACHFQHFPALNAFGRSFKSGGYTMVGGQSLVEGDHLSIPVTLNASLITKVRYQKRNGDNSASSAAVRSLNKGELQFPDEAAFLLGGRVGEHIGFLLESSIKDSGTNFNSYKMPIVFNVAGNDLSVIPFTTDSQGASYGFELFNTGALRLNRVLEHRKDISAQQYIEPGSAYRGATGVALVASQPLGYFNYSRFVTGDASATGTGPYLTYLRAAVTPTVSGWDLGAGVQWWTGTSKTGDNPGTYVHADAWALDAQAQGVVGNLPLGVYVTYANAKKSKSSAANESNVFNTNTAGNKTAWTITGELGVLPHKLTVAAAYRGGNTGATASNDADNAATLGFVYEPLQNVEVQLNTSWYMGDVEPGSDDGNNLTTLMLFAAF